MGLINRYLEDVQRVSTELAPTLGGALEAPQDDVTWAIRGRRASRDVRIELNQLQGTFAVACAVGKHRLKSLWLIDDRAIFAGKSEPYVGEHLQVSTRWDGEALWRLLPETTRAQIVKLLAPEFSLLLLSEKELHVLLGPSGLLGRHDAAAHILGALDRLLSVAAVIEDHWNVDPQQVGGGEGAGSSSAPAGAATPAQAETVDDEPGKLHFIAGQSYFARALYAEAITEFTEAIRLSGRWLILEHIGLCYQRLGQVEKAVECIVRLQAALAATSCAQ